MVDIVVLFVALVVLLILAGYIGLKKNYYAVYTADNSVEYLTRRPITEWEVKGTAVFRDSQNHRITFSTHWILKIVELSKEDWTIAYAKAVTNAK